MGQRIFAYRINADNRVVWVTPEWGAFARENQAAGLTAATVVGRPLHDFVSDKETEHLYDLIIERVRRTHKAVVVPFRCDAPDMRRFMELQVTPAVGDELEFESRLLREEPRTRVDLLDSAIERSDALVVVCSWCKRVETEEGWVEVELAVRSLQLFDLTALPGITHGICESCAARLEHDIVS